MYLYLHLYLEPKSRWSLRSLPTGTLCSSLLFFPYLLWSHPNDLRPTYWLTDQLEQTARTQPGCTRGCACSGLWRCPLSGRRGRRQLMLSSPSCSSIYCLSVTTRKQNLFIACLLFSNIYTFCCSMKKVFDVLVINFPYCSQRRRVLKNCRILQGHILQKGNGGKRLSYDLGYCTHLR